MKFCSTMADSNISLVQIAPLSCSRRRPGCPVYRFADRYRISYSSLSQLHFDPLPLGLYPSIQLPERCYCRRIPPSRRLHTCETDRSISHSRNSASRGAALPANCLYSGSGCHSLSNARTQLFNQQVSPRTTPGTILPRRPPLAVRLHR